MSSNARQTAQVSVPQSKSDPAAVKVEEIPLPPQEMWAELDNAAPAARGASDVPLEGTARKATAKPPQAKLNFRPGATSKTISLQYPFEHPLTGEVEEITVRRLTVGEVGELLDRLEPEAKDNFQIYSAMTGLPAEVLRGLVDVDGEEVSQVCYDFLPRIFRPRAKEPSSTSTDGGK